MYKGLCSYCGAQVTSNKQKEHVFPGGLYPKCNTDPKVQRLTIPACDTCNGSWSDDEAHFRNVVGFSGKANEAVRELLANEVERALNKADDAHRRKEDMWEIIRTVKMDEGDRLAIYPAESKAVLRIIRKIIRGLSYHHQLLWPISDERVWADVGEKNGVTPCILDNMGLLDEMEYHHRDKKIVEWWYSAVGYQDFLSVWVIRFYERTTFIGAVAQVEASV